MSKVSIILVSHQRPQMVREAISSLLSQTMLDWELVIVENSGKDDKCARTVCGDAAASDVRIKVLYHDENVDNIAVCWNEGLDVITGEYWGTIDDDNKKDPTFCEKMSAYLDEHRDKSAVVCGMRHIGDKSGDHLPWAGQLERLHIENAIDSGEILYRRSVVEKIGQFDERLVCQEDWGYVLRLLRLAGPEAFGFLGETLCEYRWHPEKRMLRSIDLGMIDCAALLRGDVRGQQLRVAFHAPSDKALTVSQATIKRNLDHALQTLPFVETVQSDAELSLVVGPLWTFSAGEIGASRNGGTPSMALLIEDPQGMPGNLQCIDAIDWLVTNDTHSYHFYRTVVPRPEQVYQWNCLSLTDEVLGMDATQETEKQHDVCFVGYPYPSRVEFIRTLRPLISNASIVLLGDGWDAHEIPNVSTFPTLSEVETAKIGLASRIIVCKHRTSQDCGGFPIVVPGSVNRGYIECAYRALVMIDSDRPFSAFKDEVEWYESANDAAEKIKHYLANPDQLQEKADRAFAIAPRFTYKERLGKILNAWRSPRYNVKVD